MSQGYLKEKLISLVRIEEFESAAPIARQIVQETNNINMLEVAAQIEEGRQEWETARRLRTRLAAEDPRSALAMIKLANATYRSGQYNKAVKYLVHAEGLISDDVAALTVLGKGYEQVNLLFSAKRVFEKVMETDSSQTEAEHHLSEVKAVLGNFAPSVSFYIPCYNAEEHIEMCLSSVLAQTYPIAECIIINDGSTDKSRHLLKNYPVYQIEHKENLGLSAARNTALTHASGELIASVDSDVTIDPTWLETLVLHFQNPNLAGINGRMIEANTVAIPDRWRSVHMEQNLGTHANADPNMIFGCNTVFRVAALEEVGGYKSKLRTNNEDYDLFMRVRENGWAFRYEPRALCHHMRQDTIASVLRTHARWFEPFYDRQGLYAYYHTLEQRLQVDIQKGSQLLLEDMETKRSSISYLSFLLPFYQTISNLSFFFQKNTQFLDHHQLADLAEDIGASIQALLLQRDVDHELISMIFEDIGPILEPLLKADGLEGRSMNQKTEIHETVVKELSDYYAGSLQVPQNQNDVPQWALSGSRRILAAGITEVIVYGGGEVGRAFVAAAQSCNLLVRCIVDRNKNLHGTRINGVRIVSLQQAMIEGINDYVVASFAFRNEIVQTIKSSYVTRQSPPRIHTLNY